jgi:hypothetical protein
MNQKEFHFRATLSRPNRAFIWNENWVQGCYILWPVDSIMFRREYLNMNKTRGLPYRDSTFEVHAGKFISYDGHHCMAFSSNRPSSGVMAHEALHFVNFVLDDLGNKASFDDDEKQAYFLQWTVNHLHRLTRGRE